jgi:hypothetical protein
MGKKRWWRWEELNLRHGAYETPALPLSYTAGSEDDAGLQDGILPYRPPLCPESCPSAAPWRREGRVIADEVIEVG